MRLSGASGSRIQRPNSVRGPHEPAGGRWAVRPALHSPSTGIRRLGAGRMMGVLAAAVAALPLAIAAAAWWSRSRLLLVTVDGSSMLPTYYDGDRLLVRRCTSSRSLRTGMVVVVDLPEEEQALPGSMPAMAGALPVTRVVKRIQATAGEPLPGGVPGHRTAVPAGQLVLFGDNPATSVDSRRYGCVRNERVVGVVLRRMSRRAQPPVTHPSQPAREVRQVCGPARWLRACRRPPGA